MPGLDTVRSLLKDGKRGPISASMLRRKTTHRCRVIATVLFVAAACNPVPDAFVKRTADFAALAAEVFPRASIMSSRTSILARFLRPCVQTSVYGVCCGARAG